MLTNAILSEKLGISLTKVRRWTKEFLPPDPKATRRSGYTREISNNDAFFVCLGGYIVSTLGFSFYQAQAILEILKPWFFRMGLVPDANLLKEREGIEKEIRRGIEIFIYSSPDSDEFGILVDGVISIGSQGEKDSTGCEYKRWNRQHATYWLNNPVKANGERIFKEYPTPRRALPIWILFNEFIERIFGENRFIEWWINWEERGGRKVTEIK